MIRIDETAAPSATRAALAHETPPTDPKTVQAQGEALIQQGTAISRARLTAGLDTVRSEARKAGEALSRLATGKGTKADVTAASKIMGVIADAGDTVASQLRTKGAVSPAELLNRHLAPLVKAALPGLDIKGARKALAVASRLLTLSRDPSFKGLAGIVNAVRGNPSASARKGGNGLGDFLVSTVLGAMSGQPLTLPRFLAGALRGAGKDLKAYALTMDQPQTAQVRS